MGISKLWWLKQESPAFRHGECQLKYYYVVNVKYTTLPEKRRKTHLPPARNRTGEKVAADYLKRSGVTLENIKGDKAYYSPIMDKVVLPLMTQFKRASEYYSTLFHELGHSTGHPLRLGRFEVGIEALGKGKEDYAREELVAEFTAAMLNNYCVIDDEKSDRNSAAYLQNWSQAIKDDPQMFVYAAYKADAAAHLITGQDKKDIVEPTEAA